MAATCWPILVAAALGATPVTAPSAVVSDFAPVETAVAPYEPRYYFDCPAPWLHGYVQEIPAHAGFYSFRPYNYKHVFMQSQTVGGWGLSPTAPYSQEYWHRERPGHANAALPQITPTGIVPVGAWQAPWSPR
jgi:hypothetical protein